ncbi:serine hydrolase, partial [Psychrobacter sp. 1U2]
MPITLPEDATRYDSAYSALVYGWILGGVIEAVTDMTLAEALRCYLTEPLGIANSCYFGVPSDKVDKVAVLVKDFETFKQDHSVERPKLSSHRNKPVLKPDSKNTLRTYANLSSYKCWKQHAAKLQTTKEHSDDKNTEEFSILDTAQINRLYLNTSQLNLKNYKAALIPANKQPIDYYNRQTLQAVIP